MTNITYPWNPYNENEDCIIKNEIVNIPGGVATEFIPRAAPYFALGIRVYTKDGVKLTLGEDYALGRPFMDFIRTYNRNVFGSIIIFRHVKETELSITYNTIGDPFILDYNIWLEYTANILENPRTCTWEDIVGKPTVYPPDPHPHSLYETYDYEDFLEALYALIGTINNVDGKEEILELAALYRLHITEKEFPRAHMANKLDIGLGNVSNLSVAENEDLKGNSNNLLITVAQVKYLLDDIVHERFNNIKDDNDRVDNTIPEVITLKSTNTIRLAGDGTKEKPLIAQLNTDDIFNINHFHYTTTSLTTDLLLPIKGEVINVFIDKEILYKDIDYKVDKNKITFTKAIEKDKVIYTTYFTLNNME